MKISVITPTFNAVRFIRHTLASIQAQTHPDVEHIIMDKQSTDATRRICAEYRNIFCSQEDVSLYDALNKGILKSAGEVIAFLNADDLYPSRHTLERVACLFAENPAADVVYGKCEMVDARLRHLYTHQPKPLDFRFAIRRVFVVNHAAVFVRRPVFDRFGLYDLALKHMADCEYWLRLLRGGARFLYCDEILAVFRRHDHNLSSTPGAGMRETRHILQKYGYRHIEWLRKAYLLKDSLNNPDYLRYLLRREWARRNAV